MKKYIGTKSVEALPMSLGEFINRTKRNPYENDPNNHSNDEEGYYVKYEDGYESWSPKEVFEKAYKIADTFKDRLMIEQQELAGRLYKLCSFVDSPKFKEVVTDNEQQELLYEQCQRMSDYLRVLNKRLTTLSE